MKRAWILGLALLGAAAAAGVAVSARAQDVGASSTEISAANVRIQETPAGDLVADAIRSDAGANIAFVPADALKGTSIPAGTLSRDNLASLLKEPDEKIAVLTLSGTQVKEALERSLTFLGRPFTGFLQVSGLTMAYDPDKPVDARVVDVKVNGAPLRDDARYKVAMTSRLAGGAQGYFEVWSKDGATSGGPILQAMMDYVKRKGRVSPRVEGRIAPR